MILPEASTDVISQINGPQHLEMLDQILENLRPPEACR